MDKKNLELAIELRHDLHMHPELSNEEVWTKQHLLNFIQYNTTNLDVIDYGNWFYAAYRVGEEGKPVYAFRADFDALPMDEVIDIPWGSKIPGVAHKCGHDGHSASLMGFALEVDQKGADKNIIFIFQPGEEVGDGAIQCVSVLTEENVDKIFGYHTWDGNVQPASTGIIIKFQGTPAHAAQPQDGINPSFAIATIINKIPSLQEDAKDRLLCTIVNVNIGEPNFGLSASYGELLLTVRALYEEELNKLRDSLLEMANDEAEKYGLTVSFEYSDSFPETKNTKECVDEVRTAAKEKGIEVVEMNGPISPSEDFGHYAKVVPAAFVYIGNGENYPHIHTSDYDFRDDILETAVELFKGIAGVK